MRYPTPKVKIIVAQRAKCRCEYCHLPSIDSYYGFQIDHIISIRHGGKTILINLALSCPDCNRNKGTDLGSILEIGGKIIPFFNPRIDIWGEHFELDETGFIYHKTPVGEVTSKFFQFNHPDRIIERSLLLKGKLMDFH
jgi:HNH endonuclease